MEMCEIVKCVFYQTLCHQQPNYREPMLQRQLLFPKILPFKRICCYKEYQHAAVWNVIKTTFWLFTPRNTCCGCLLESPRRGDSNKYPQHMFLGV